MDYAAWNQADRLSVVVCGSFRRDVEGLRLAITNLQEAGCVVLSPHDVDFVREVDGFVYAESDLGQTSSEVEWNHLRSMEKADFVWLHSPGGYVGSSAAMELGFARAGGLRVFTSHAPVDATLKDGVRVLASPAEAVREVLDSPGEAPAHSLPALQSYYARVARVRGWAGETADDTLGLLRGEVAELEEALAQPDAREAALMELADVQLYVVHLANILCADLGTEVKAKERINASRFDPETITA
jgi:NTP pyrophosphatase (non-canonical NTP hydrolase)